MYGGCPVSPGREKASHKRRKLLAKQPIEASILQRNQTETYPNIADFMMKGQLLPLWLCWLTLGQGFILRDGSGTDELQAPAPAPREAEPKKIPCSVEPFQTIDPWSVVEVERATLLARAYEYLTTSSLPDDIIPPTASVSISTTVIPTGTAQVLPSLSDDVEPHTTGLLFTKLNASGRPTELPLLTAVIPQPVSLLQPLFTTTTTTASNAVATKKGSRLFKMAVVDIFANPIDTKAPPSQIKVRSDHPVPRKGIKRQPPIQTNKFYSNFFLSTQLAPTFTFPYSIAWAGGQGASLSWGISISHIEASQRVFGAAKYNNAKSYFINPVGIQSMVISAKELGKNTVLTTDNMNAFAARVLLSKDSKSAPAVSFPIIQGMAYLTAQYNGAVPLIQTGVYFKTMTRVTKDPKSNVAKYNFNLEDGTTWRVYAYKTKGDQLDLQVMNNGLAQAKKPFYGILQVVKDPKTTGSEAILDDGAGIYPITMAMTGSVSGTTGSYTFSYTKAGHQTGNLYMFALPHHLASFDAATKSRVKSFKMQSTTKGIATLVRGTQWTMVETSLATGMGFAPWLPNKGSLTKLSTKAKAAIHTVAQKEVSQDMMAQSNLDSMYFSGKALAKFGNIIYVLNDLLGDKALAQAGLNKLKAAFAIFASNKQQYPLVYEKAWGGVVSSATYVTGNDGADFGNTYYNDHHFHYGYHILAAAYIGHLDSKWLAANKDYVNTLVRDIANPSSKDNYFPKFRNFDWYHGHSWAHGLYAAFDGKDQESSSEDMMSAYAVKMWGTVIKDNNMVARANLQLAVLARSLDQYYLYKSNNSVQPKEFIGNKVAGILFENKIDHTTYFDPNIEAIQGIHMIPILPPSAYVRTNEFVKEEWAAYFDNGRINSIKNAWRGVIYANYATINPKAAYAAFSAKSFDPTWIDGGASLTWYMAYSAVLGGV
ncbi:hypothetical protein G7046_g7293 [Stylonectria norvegica]|nr:hypothetical protein G7046_g7293 [Stylonectria norvegica]